MTVKSVSLIFFHFSSTLPSSYAGLAPTISLNFSSKICFDCSLSISRSSFWGKLSFHLRHFLHLQITNNCLVLGDNLNQTKDFCLPSSLRYTVPDWYVTRLSLFLNTVFATSISMANQNFLSFFCPSHCDHNICFLHGSLPD